jgi:hypothetical protein
MKIQVTRNMVDYALQQTSTLCAVALALRDANDDWILPRVTQEDIRVTDRRTGKRITIPTPPKVAAWIDKFDRQREAVGAFSFDLDLTQATTRPMQHITPSGAIKQAERNARAKVRNTQKRTPANYFKNTNKRELRPAEVTGLVD